MSVTHRVGCGLGKHLVNPCVLVHPFPGIQLAPALMSDNLCQMYPPWVCPDESIWYDPFFLQSVSCLLNRCIIYLLYLLDIKISIFDYAVWNNRWSQGNLEITMHFSHFWSQGSPRPRSWQVQRLGDVSASIGSQCLLAVHGWPALGLTVKNDWPSFRT